MTIEELDSDTRKAIEELLEYQGVPAIKTDNQTINTSLTYGTHEIGAILESETASKRVESGDVSVSEPSDPSDDTWGTSNNNSTSVTFSTSFSNSPKLMLGGGAGLSFRGTYGWNNKSTTGADVVVRKFRTNSLGSPFIIDWIAVGDD
jgi:hypothetical protein